MTPVRLKKIFNRFLPHAPIALIVFLGGVLRFLNLNWDRGYLFHPDEINVLTAIHNIQIPGQLDPKFYAYNGFPFYLDRLILQVLQRITGDAGWVTSFSQMNLVARSVSAIFSTLTVALIYLLVKRLLDKNSALLSAALAAFTPALIQYAHYGVTESLMLFLLLGMVWASLRLFQNNSSGNWVLMSVFSGLAIGTKTTAVSFLIIPFLTWALMIRKTEWRAAIIHGCAFVVQTGLIAFISSPYSVLNLTGFLASMNYEQGVATGSFPVPYTMQFIGTVPYWFQFKNLLWQTSPLVAVVGILGVTVGWYKSRDKVLIKKILPWLAFSVIYFIYVGRWLTKFDRYMLPVIPIIIFGCAWAYFRLTRIKKFSLAANWMAGVLLAVSILWTAAYMNVYIAPSTRITASDWIYQNAPAGSVLLGEHWDYDLPVSRPSGNPGQYNLVVMKNYDPDTPQKVEDMASNLAEGDYLILGSRRLSGSIPRAPLQYPVTSKYYDKLFRGELGYQLVNVTAVYPQLGPWVINDDSTEETFQVYDHPVIKIFKNTGHLSREQLLQILENI
ncbi:MAG: glycosyltransferase family 39 protein [Candidatus Doudnabacteria bacterium]|nr:glycosyltransferase family 39 protein [Candidatus Doudnabacteria bacterium]